MVLEDRAKNNEINCIGGVGQLLYSLAQYGVLAEPYRSWAAGFTPIEGVEYENYKKAILDLAESLVMFNDEIKEDGKIIASSDWIDLNNTTLKSNV